MKRHLVSCLRAVGCKASLSLFVIVRPDDSGWDDIALFACDNFDSCILYIGSSDVVKRSWYILYTDRGPVYFGL